MAMRNKAEYSELCKTPVSESRNVVISTCSKGGYTIAQQLTAKEGDKITSVFMKGAFHVDDIKGLYSIRDCINLAIKMEEESIVDDGDWDDAE